MNHKQTAREELGGGFLWSPKREANGARSQFYDNMRRTEPGELVLSFSGGTISHLGVIQDYAISASKPIEFGSGGNNWSYDGWLLPVAWQKLETSVRPKSRISKLKELLPSKYSPIHPVSGNGNQKAYLAEVDKRVFDLLLDVNISEYMAEAESYPIDILTIAEDIVEAKINIDTDLDTATKRQLVLARYGQGLFRSRVAKVENACRLTAISNLALLVASHIKPWRDCSSATERLDGANGLLLAPHVDRLFDRGLISFKASGRVLVSPRLKMLDLDRLGLRDACQRNCGTFNDRQEEYLSFHRNNVYLG